MKKLLALAAAIVLALPSAYAAEPTWTRVVGNNDVTFYVVDASAVTVSLNVKRVLEKETFAVAKQGVTDLLAVVDYNCSTKTMTLLAITLLDAEGTALHTYMYGHNEPETVQQVNPDTISEVKMKYVCALKAPPLQE